MKKLLSLLMALALVLTLAAPALATEIEKVQEEHVTTTLALWDSGYLCVPRKTIKTQYADGACSAVYGYTIQIPRGDTAANFTVTLKGENGNFTAVTGEFSDICYNRLSYFATYSGATATVYLFWDGQKIGSLDYTLSSGDIRWV